MVVVVVVVVMMDLSHSQFYTRWRDCASHATRQMHLMQYTSFGALFIRVKASFYYAESRRIRVW